MSQAIGLLFFIMIEAIILSIAFVFIFYIASNILVLTCKVVTYYATNAIPWFLKTTAKEKIRNIVDFICAEWIFKFFPNGGTAVFIRTVFVGSTICYLLFLTYSFFATNPLPFFELLPKQLFKIASIYAAVYAAFYARFVSQWTYLSNLYNQIKEAELNTNLNLVGKSDLLYGWMSGFIEDAEDLHMETKEVFATVILNWIAQHPKVKDKYIEYNPCSVLQHMDGTEKFEKLFRKLNNIKKRRP